MCVSWGIQNCCVQVENAKCMCSSRKCKNVWCWSRKSRCTSWNASCQHDAPFRRVSSAVALQWPLEIARPPIYNIRASRKSFNVPKENYAMHVGSPLIGLYKTFAPAFHTRLTDICLVPMSLLSSHAPLPLCDDEHIKCCHLRWR